jgi:gentisate 1,2-dioxygenase
MQLLPVNFKGKAHTNTQAHLYQCAKVMVIPSSTENDLTGKERDIFCVPSWAWHEHQPILSETKNACLFFQRFTS